MVERKWRVRGNGREKVPGREKVTGSEDKGK